MISRPITLLKLDTEESRCLDYFLHVAGPRLAGAQDSPFWTQFVPQACHTDPATRNAVMAISHLFEHPPATAELLSQSYHHSRQSQLLKWHSRSVDGYRNRLNTLHGIEQTELALLSCVLLTSIEYQLRNTQNAAALLNSGYDIAGTLSNYASASPSPTIKDLLIPILARQTVLMRTFDCLPPNEWFARFQDIAPTPTTSINSLNEARAALYTCLWNSLNFVYSVYKLYALGPDVAALGLPPTLRETQAAHVRDLGLWHRYFLLFVNEKLKQPNEKEAIAISIMLMYYHVAFIWTSSCAYFQQRELDIHIPRFQSINSLAENILRLTHYQSKHSNQSQVASSFSFEMGIVPALNFTGLKCRHPLIRREAVELMRKGPRQEALFSAELTALTVEKIIQVEEGPTLAESIAAGTWDGKMLPSEEERCYGATLHFQKVNGDAVRPQVCYLRGTKVDAEGKRQHIRECAPLFECRTACSIA